MEPDDIVELMRDVASSKKMMDLFPRSTCHLQRIVRDYRTAENGDLLFDSRVGGRDVGVKFPRHQGWAWFKYTANACGLILPKWARNKHVVTHELSHMIHFMECGSHEAYISEQGHGREFCRIFVHVAQVTLGKEEADKLKTSMRVRGVKYSAKRARRELSDDQKQALCARLETARAAKVH